MSNTKNIQTLLETIDIIEASGPRSGEHHPDSEGTRSTEFELDRAKGELGEGGDRLSQIQAQIAALQAEAQKLQGGMPPRGNLGKEITAAMAARREAMQQAWLHNDLERITHPDDLAVAQKSWSEREGSFTHGGPPDIAGEEHDIWDYANKKNKEQYEKELAAREEAKAQGLEPEPWSGGARKGAPDAPDLYKWAVKKNAEFAAKPKKPTKNLSGDTIEPEIHGDQGR